MSEKAKAVGEAGVDMIKDLINQIIVERVIPAEQKLRKRKLLGTETNRSDSEDN